MGRYGAGRLNRHLQLCVGEMILVIIKKCVDNRTCLGYGIHSLSRGESMNKYANIGARIKELRTANKYTLKRLSEESGLSIGFLSQVERGMSSIAIDSLEEIASIFNTSLSRFFDFSGQSTAYPVIHSFEVAATPISQQIIQYVLSNNVEAYHILPRIFLLLPFSDLDVEKVEMYSHEGEEFIYVLEGIVTVYLDDVKYTLYPGDSLITSSLQRHNWRNLTNKNARILTINTPNPFQKAGPDAGRNE